jgi:heterokaryon incompatibility protein (HET)
VMAETHTYSELSQGSLRLLRFTCNTSSYEIECELVPYPVGKTPKYNALSYCWGESARSSFVLCNGKRLMVTSVLSKILKRLVSLERSGIEWIWIDQICINQINAVERGNQVSIMKDIYQNSEGTIIWLGPEVSGIDATMMLTEMLSRLRHKDLSLNGSGRKRRRYTREEYKALNLPLKEDLSWKAFGEILSRPWFIRTWVIQEVVLSRIHPRVVCGSYELEWEKILDSAAWLTSMGHDLTPLSLDMKAWPALRSLNLFNELRIVGLPCDLTTLLNKAIRFKASDPRDRVYSLLGLTGEMDDIFSIPIPLQPDYGKPVRDVFIDVTRHIIMSARNLRILTLIRYIPDWHSYPSWAVDFAADIQWERISYFVWSCHIRTGWHGVKEIPNNAAGGLLVDLGVSSSDNVLALSGLRIDTITSICQTISKSDLDTFGPQTLFAWKSACQRAQSRYITNDALARAFMVTLAANWNLSMRERIADQPMCHFWAYMWRVYRRLYQERISDEIWSDIENEYKGFLDLPDVGDADLFRLHLDAAHNRRIFFTKDLSYFGLGPCIMQENDILCVLFGGATPMILRPEGGQHRFIGECYVYDLMNGEAIDDWHNGKYTTEIFQLV